MHEVSFEDLSAHADDELGPEERARIEAHLRGCSECLLTAREIAELKALTRAAVEVEPPLHLWVKIAAKATEPSWANRLLQRFRSPALAWSFSLAMAALAIAFFLQRPIQKEPQPIDEARQTYIAAIQRLEAAATSEAAQLPPKTRETLLENLAVIDRAISEAERALAASPEDQEGQRLLLAMYDEKVRVLSAIGQAVETLEEGSGP